MKWDKLTVMSQEAFHLAQSKAEEMGHQELKPEHLLWAFLSQEDNVVLSVLAKIGSNSVKIREELEKALDKLPKVKGEGDTVRIDVNEKKNFIFS